MGLEGALPFRPMRFDPPAKPFKREQMGNLVYQGDQEPILVGHGIYGDLMAPIWQGAVIPMTGDPLIDNLQMYRIGTDQLHAGCNCAFR